MFKTMILFALFSLFASAQIDFKGHMTINGKDSKMMMPSMPTSVELWFTDPRSGEIYKDFKIMHGKIMHMVIVKDDLSQFRHVHPYLDPVTGRFQITFNIGHSDPDNFHAANALVEPGMYMIMADVEIKGVGMRMAHFMVMAKGESEPRPMDLDPINSDLSITKYFKVNESDERPKYKTSLKLRTIEGCGANLNDFSLELFSLNNEGAYAPIKELQPWLSQGGHAIWMSESPMGLMNQMAMAHMHSLMPVDDHILRFNSFDDGRMIPGKQKIWIQFKHQDNVMTIPFVFDYYPPPVSNDNC